MPEGHIVETFRENARVHLPERAHAQITHPFAGRAPGRKKVPHGHHGNVAPRAQPFRLQGGFAVMFPHAFGHEPVALVPAFAFPCAVQVSFQQKGHGADNEFRFAVGPVQHKDLVLRLLCPARDVNAHDGKQRVRRIQKRGGIVIARHHHHMAAGAGRGEHLAQKAVIHFLRARAGERAVEHVSGNKQRFHAPFVHKLPEPGEKGLKFLAASLAVKLMTEMPVGSVKNVHGRGILHDMCCARRPVKTPPR